MDKIKLLQTRRRDLLSAGKAVREEINELIDKDSFVEFSSFSFSESDFYGEKAEGEGVITGFATIDDSPYYIVAQNAAVLSGGVSKANCEKICKCLEQAEKNGTPVIYMLSTLGVRIGEGVNVLEGLAQLILQVSRLKDSVTQYLIVNGEVYGQISLLAGLCDFTFFIDKKSYLATTSPLVITAAAGQNVSKDGVAGADALKKSGLVTFKVKNLAEAKQKIIALEGVLSYAVEDCDDLNSSLPELNKKADGKALLGIFDKGSAIELGEGYAQKVKCYLARIGGIAVASVIFDDADGVKLCPCAAEKLKDFASLACAYSLPFITFVNTLGIKESPEVENSRIIKTLGDFVRALDNMTSAKISIVYGKAIGLGYTLFAAKSMGYDFTYAFANAEIGLFDGAQGAEIELAKGKDYDAQKLAEKYSSEHSDPINAAKGGYIDDIIEPAFVRQYLIASLQMLVK